MLSQFGILSIPKGGMGFLSSFRGEDRSTTSHNSDYSDCTHLSQGASVVPRIKSESFPKKQTLYGTQTEAAEQCDSIPGQIDVIKLYMIDSHLTLVRGNSCVCALASHPKARHVQGPSIIDWRYCILFGL